ncbi:MAG: hypothetical protein GX558_09115 [Clostridiales bacterium]|nr:hypothetical protein [Clostridiales bacterium]
MGNAIDRYLDGLYESAPRRLSVSRAMETGMPLHLWRGELRSALVSALGEWPDAVALNVRELSRTQRPGHTRVKLTYDSEPGLSTAAYLLIPDGIQGKRPAVVACTGHGYGCRDIVGLNEDFTERDGGQPTYQKDFGLALVKRGFVVLAPEPLGFGEMMLAGDQGNSCHRLSQNLLLVGRTMIGARTQQHIAAVTLLSQLPEADAGRIGAMGISGGGLDAAFLAMLDPRVRALVCSGYACRYRESIWGLFHCVDNFAPGLMNLAENADLMALVAPRPMLWESGSRDPIFPRAGVEAAQAEVAAVYRALHAESDFAVDYFEGEHEISGRLAYDFLASRLGA